MLIWYSRVYLMTQEPVITIIQGSIEDISESCFLEKCPVIFNESLMQPSDILNTLLYGLCIKGTATHTEDVREGVVKKRFKLLYHKHQQESMLRIAHPYNANAPVIDIKLQPFQVIVLPYKFKFSSSSGFCSIDVHDVISLLCGWMF